MQDEALYTAKRNGRNQVQRWSKEQTSAIHPYDSGTEDKDISLAL